MASASVTTAATTTATVEDQRGSTCDDFKIIYARRYSKLGGQEIFYLVPRLVLVVLI